ncbi:putative transcription factor NAM family [Helianthus anomalus]
MYYLRRKACGKPFRFQAVTEIDVYKSEPWELADIVYESRFCCLKFDHLIHFCCCFNHLIHFCCCFNHLIHF